MHSSRGQSWAELLKRPGISPWTTAYKVSREESPGRARDDIQHPSGRRAAMGDVCWTGVRPPGPRSQLCPSPVEWPWVSPGAVSRSSPWPVFVQTVSSEWVFIYNGLLKRNERKNTWQRLYALQSLNQFLSDSLQKKCVDRWAGPWAFLGLRLPVYNMRGRTGARFAKPQTPPQPLHHFRHIHRICQHLYIF